MVAIGIMVSLLSISLGYSRRGGEQIILFKERARVMQEIARARSLTATLFKEEGEKVCGYGIYIVDQRTFTVFKDLPTTNDECNGNNKLFGPVEASEELDTFTLDPQVEIRQESTDTTILFLPPKPDLYFDGNIAAAGNSEREITLELISTGDTLSVSVNQLGQISSLSHEQ
ncbi:MAG: hypothetical protein R3B52_02565 [Candidatus Paceibacterota bacterium]